MIKLVKELYYKRKYKFYKDQKYYIAVDFDGTLVKDRFPKIGMTKHKTVKRLTNHVELLQAAGVKPVIILWTCRWDDGSTEFFSSDYLANAKDWCERRLPKSIQPTYYNENPERGHGSPKIFAYEYWDDCARRIK